MKVERMKHPTLRFVVSLVLLLVALTFSYPAAVHAEMLFNITLSVPATIYENPCTGEPVVLSGDLHMLAHVTEDNQGGYHVGYEINTQGLQGEGLVTGTDYRASDTFAHSFYARDPFPVTNTTTMDTELLSQGGTDNFVMHSNVHTTVNAEGVPTAVVDNIWLECRG